MSWWVYSTVGWRYKLYYITNLQYIENCVSVNTFYNIQLQWYIYDKTSNITKYTFN